MVMQSFVSQIDRGSDWIGGAGISSCSERSKHLNAHIQSNAVFFLTIYALLLCRIGSRCSLANDVEIRQSHKYTSLVNQR